MLRLRPGTGRICDLTADVQKWPQADSRLKFFTGFKVHSKLLLFGFFTSCTPPIPAYSTAVYLNENMNILKTSSLRSIELLKMCRTSVSNLRNVYKDKGTTPEKQKKWQFVDKTAAYPSHDAPLRSSGSRVRVK